MALLIADGFAHQFDSVAKATAFAVAAFRLSQRQAEMLRASGSVEWENADGGVRGVTIY